MQALCYSLRIIALRIFTTVAVFFTVGVYGQTIELVKNINTSTPTLAGPVIDQSADVRDVTAFDDKIFFVATTSSFDPLTNIVFDEHLTVTEIENDPFYGQLDTVARDTITQNVVYYLMHFDPVLGDVHVYSQTATENAFYHSLHPSPTGTALWVLMGQKLWHLHSGSDAPIQVTTLPDFFTIETVNDNYFVAYFATDQTVPTISRSGVYAINTAGDYELLFSMPSTPQNRNEQFIADASGTIYVTVYRGLKNKTHTNFELWATDGRRETLKRIAVLGHSTNDQRFRHGASAFVVNGEYRMLLQSSSPRFAVCGDPSVSIEVATPSESTTCKLLKPNRIRRGMITVSNLTQSGFRNTECRASKVGGASERYFEINALNPVELPICTRPYDVKASTWVTDGTRLGTKRWRNRSGTNLFDPLNPHHKVGNWTYFIATTPSGGVEGNASLMRSRRNGSRAQVLGRLARKNLPASWFQPEAVDLQYFAKLGDHLYFAGDDGLHGRELWRIGIGQSPHRLTPYMVDPKRRGWLFGNTADRDAVRYTFTGLDIDLVLSTRGFDIDYYGEVSVELNGERIGLLHTGLNRALTARSYFLLTADRQRQGQNTLAFVPTTPGNKYGIYHPRIQPAFEAPVVGYKLPFGAPLLAGYRVRAAQYDATAHIAGRRLLFHPREPISHDLMVRARGFDIDSDDEVSVHFNDELLGYLHKTANNQRATKRNKWKIPVAKVQETNTLEFRVKTLGERWGVSNVLISFESLSP